MFFEKKKGIISLALAGCLLFTTEFEVLAANPQSEAQAMDTMTYEIEVAPLADTWSNISAMADIAVDTQEWQGKALANTDNNIDVLDNADGAVIGKMFKNTIVTVEEQGDTWCKISSGNVVGYVKTESLLFGSEAVTRAEIVCEKGTKDAKTLEEVKKEEEAAKKKVSQRKLMAAIIFCEAGNQPYNGKVAVGAVIMNRVKSGRFPNTIEGVIYQRGQFTPAMTGKLSRVLNSGKIPGSCYDAADAALNGENPIGGALFFNTHNGKFKLGDHYFS